MQFEEIKVSIIVPVFGVEDCLRNCIESILGQSFSEFELILVDDGSLDQSGKICDEYAGKDSRIKVYHHQENHGSSAARYKGYREASGKYIAFVDADDYIERDYIEQFMNAAAISRADMICCNCIDEGETGQNNFCIEKHQIIEDKNDIIKMHLSDMRFAYVLWGKVFRKEVLEKVSFIFIRYTEDTHMFLESLLYCSKIELLPYKGYHYVVRKNSLTSVGNKQEIYLSNLITIQYLCELCQKYYPRYFEQARQKVLDKMFICLGIEYKEKKKDHENLYLELNPYFHWLDGKGLNRKKKNIFLKFYRKKPKTAGFLLSIYYKMKREKA